MLIAHASIPSDHPEKAAKVLADIMNGEATPFFPGGRDSFMAWSGDGSIFIEVIKRGTPLLRTPQGAEYTPHGESERRFTEMHLAIAVDRPAREIIAIAERAGWPALAADRGTFHLVEVWVDGVSLIEFLDPAQTRIYREKITLENWKAVSSAVPT
jgi:hypothetical protein